MNDDGFRKLVIAYVFFLIILINNNLQRIFLGPGIGTLELLDILEARDVHAKKGNVLVAVWENDTKKGSYGLYGAFVCANKEAMAQFTFLTSSNNFITSFYHRSIFRHEGKDKTCSLRLYVTVLPKGKIDYQRTPTKDKARVTHPVMIAKKYYKFKLRWYDDMSTNEKLNHIEVLDLRHDQDLTILSNKVIMSLIKNPHHRKLIDTSMNLPTAEEARFVTKKEGFV